MKPFCIFTVVFLLAGICSVNAQDMILLKDGNTIEAKVTRISPREIRYKRLDHLDGPTIIIPIANVLSIKYENGAYEIINADAMPQQESTQDENPNTMAMDTNKFIFGINANAGGALGYAWGSSGAGINIELGKGKFNSEINLMFPIGGFGALFTFNGFWPSNIGGFYFGGGIGFGIYEAYVVVGEEYVGGNYRDIYGYDTVISLPIGLNIGYKFITKSGLYFRTGAFLGFDLPAAIGPFYFKPDLAIGWTMK
jgi:hypothetical protein